MNSEYWTFIRWADGLLAFLSDHDVSAGYTNSSFLCLPEQFVLLPSGGHKQINRALKEAEATCSGAPVSTSEQTDLHLIYQHSQSHYSLYINCDAYCAQGLVGFEGAASSTK